MIEPVYLLWFLIFMAVYIIAGVDEMLPFPLAIPLVIGVLLFMILIGDEQHSTIYFVLTVLLSIGVVICSSFVIKSFKKNCLAVNLLDTDDKPK